MRYELADHEWTAIKPMLPNKPRGVPRVNDRRVLNGIFWVLRSGAPWRDLLDNFGPYTTCYNRFVRWRRAGVWGRIIDALASVHDAAVQMIDTSPVFLLIWLKLIFSESEVAGYKATGQVTSERRKKPFQLARGAIGYSKTQPGNRRLQDDRGAFVPTIKFKKVQLARPYWVSFLEVSGAGPLPAWHRKRANYV